MAPPSEILLLQLDTIVAQPPPSISTLRNNVHCRPKRWSLQWPFYHRHYSVKGRAFLDDCIGYTYINNVAKLCVDPTKPMGKVRVFNPFGGNSPKEIVLYPAVIILSPLRQGDTIN